ncbi:cell adhesion molecule CEACAM5-like isoform X5 [Apostichopus japonicus]|uniref:cell adhesion molecule CEACAM5-like isoform X5 n=1 Tax=Stichopus japonicus TaxID=307972 RepID=UPI003AB1E7D5
MKCFNWYTSVSYVLISVCLSSTSVHESYCPSQVSGLYGEEGMISCYFRPNFQTIIWFDETSTRDPLIRLEHSTKSGRGYDSGKYDVLQNGSLVIKTIDFINEQQYITVAVIFGSTNITEFSIVFFVIEHCPTQQSGFFGEKGNIICHFKPNFNKVSWYLEQDKPLLQMEGSHISGSGYESEKYSVTQNGSLVIHRVTEENKAIYTVILIDAYNISTVHRVEFKLENYCPSQVSGLYGEEGMISCYFRPNFHTIIWFDETSTRDPLIVLENNTKSGRSYDSGKYDVLQNGSLVIKTIDFINEQQYNTVAVKVESTNIIEFSILFSVIEHCPTQQSGFFGEKGNIICHFKPNFNKVSWYLEQDKPLIQLEGSHISGPGYENEKYSVKQNGSLVIRRVTEENKAIYTVILIDANNISTVHRVEFKLESYCPSQVSGLYGEEGMISCYFRPNFQTIIWFDETSTRDPLIRLEHSTKSGRGYDSGKYDVLQNGSLVIKTIDFINEQQYITVAVIFGSTNITEFSIVFFVIEHCPTQQSGFFEEKGNIICHFKPNFIKVSWYLEQDKPLIQMEGSYIFGPGYENEKYSVKQNGSLVIRRVTKENEAHYRVILIDANNISTVHRVEFKLENGCWGSQYGYCGKEGIINCNFEPGYGDFYWYDDTIDHTSIIRLENGVKSGKGYDSNEYDVSQNGSLVIKNVQLKHEREYKVIRYGGEHQIMEYRITFSVIGAGVTSCWSNGTASTNPETDNSRSVTTEPKFTTAYATETTKPEDWKWIFAVGVVAVAVFAVVVVVVLVVIIIEQPSTNQVKKRKTTKK